MKLLLDENIPRDLGSLLVPQHDVSTVAAQGWKGVGNGALLQLAAGAGFNALITMDSKMEYEQNLQKLPLAIVVLRAGSNAMVALEPLVPKLMDALTSLEPRRLVHVE